MSSTRTFANVAPLNHGKGETMVMIEQAFHTYIKAVEIRFEARRHPPVKKRGLEVLPNRELHLFDLVEQLEEGPEFRALIRETLAAFRSDD